MSKNSNPRSYSHAVPGVLSLWGYVVGLCHRSGTCGYLNGSGQI